jgi:ABC-type multidrug transport system ATPase subunit
MRHRTCIIVTHAVDLCLPVSSFFVSMDNGVVVASGTPDQLSATDKDLLAASAGEEHPEASASAIMIEAIAEGETDEELVKQQEEEKRQRQEKLKLIKEETQSEGAVSKEVYL